jgi:hypothetical protein
MVFEYTPEGHNDPYDEFEAQIKDIGEALVPTCESVHDCIVACERLLDIDKESRELRDVHPPQSLARADSEETYYKKVRDPMTMVMQQILRKIAREKPDEFFEFMTRFANHRYLNLAAEDGTRSDTSRAQLLFGWMGRNAQPMAARYPAQYAAFSELLRKKRQPGT